MHVDELKLPLSVERTLRFLDEADRDRLELTAFEPLGIGEGAEAFAARFAMPARPMLRFLDPRDVRDSMQWLAHPPTPEPEIVRQIVEIERPVSVAPPLPPPSPPTETRTVVVERIVEVEKPVYVPLRTFPPRGEPAPKAPAQNEAPRSEPKRTEKGKPEKGGSDKEFERSPRSEEKRGEKGQPEKGGSDKEPKNPPKPDPDRPFAGMDDAVARFVGRLGVANLGTGSYLAGLDAATPVDSFGASGAPIGRFLGGTFPGGPIVTPGPVTPLPPFPGAPGPMGGFSPFGTWSGLPGHGSPRPYPGGPFASPELTFAAPPTPGDAALAAMGLAAGTGAGALSPLVQRLVPVVVEAMRRTGGGPALAYGLPGEIGRMAREEGVSPLGAKVLEAAVGRAAPSVPAPNGASQASGPRGARLPEAQAARLGQISLVAPDLRLASRESAAGGAAVSMPWAALAQGAGPLDEAALARLGPVLPAGARLIYPALPPGTAGATNLALAPNLVARLTGAYGPAEAVGGAAADHAARAGRGAAPGGNGAVRVNAAIVPAGRPTASGSGGLFGPKADAVAEAGGGPKRGGSLDFLGVPVSLAPSLAHDGGIRREQSLARAVASASGGAPTSPEAFGLLRQRLLPSISSVAAEPDLPAWSRRANEMGLRDASPAALLSPDARAPKASDASKSQVGGGRLAQALRPFAPALALAESAGALAPRSAGGAPRRPSPPRPEPHRALPAFPEAIPSLGTSGILPGRVGEPGRPSPAHSEVSKPVAAFPFPSSLPSAPSSTSGIRSGLPKASGAASSPRSASLPQGSHPAVFPLADGPTLGRRPIGVPAPFGAHHAPPFHPIAPSFFHADPSSASPALSSPPSVFHADPPSGTLASPGSPASSIESAPVHPASPRRGAPPAGLLQDIPRRNPSFHAGVPHPSSVAAPLGTGVPPALGISPRQRPSPSGFPFLPPVAPVASALPRRRWGARIPQGTPTSLPSALPIPSAGPTFAARPRATIRGSTIPAFPTFSPGPTAPRIAVPTSAASLPHTATVGALKPGTSSAPSLPTVPIGSGPVRAGLAPKGFAPASRWMGRPSVGRSPSALAVGIAPQGAHLEASLALHPPLDLPQPVASLRLPAEAPPPTVAVRVPEARERREMPVLRRPERIQRVAVGAGSPTPASLSTSAPKGSSEPAQETGPADGARVQVLAREVYGILRRRIRDEFERSRPMGRL